MKKILLISFVFILVLNLILAVPSGGSRLQSSNDSNDNSASNLDENATNPRIGGNKDEHGCLIPAGYSWNATEQKCVREWSNGTDRYQNNSGIGQELREQIRQRKEEIRSGNYTGPQGQLLRVRMLSQTLRELRVKNMAAETDLNITAEIDEQNQTKLKVKLRNGVEKELNMLPDNATERVLQRLKIGSCNSDKNCKLELKEEKEKLKYELQVERHSRILGIFAKKMQIRSEIDPETGEVKIKKPWWAFLAREPQEPANAEVVE